MTITLPGIPLGLVLPEVVLCLMMKVEAARQVEAQNELQRWIKEAFERERMPIPFHHRVVYLRREGSKEARRA